MPPAANLRRRIPTSALVSGRPAPSQHTGDTKHLLHGQSQPFPSGKRPSSPPSPSSPPFSSPSHCLLQSSSSSPPAAVHASAFHIQSSGEHMSAAGIRHFRAPSAHVPSASASLADPDHRPPSHRSPTGPCFLLLRPFQIHSQIIPPSSDLQLPPCSTSSQARQSQPVHCSSSSSQSRHHFNNSPPSSQHRVHIWSKIGKNGKIGTNAGFEGKKNTEDLKRKILEWKLEVESAGNRKNEEFGEEERRRSLKQTGLLKSLR